MWMLNNIQQSKKAVVHFMYQGQPRRSINNNNNAIIIHIVTGVSWKPEEIKINDMILLQPRRSINNNNNNAIIIHIITGVNWKSE